MILYADFETQQFYKWLEEPWNCKIETLGPVYLEGKKDLTSESPEVVKCVQIGTRILVAMKRAIDNDGIFAEIELSDEEFNDICKVFMLFSIAITFFIASISKVFVLYSRFLLSQNALNSSIQILILLLFTLSVTSLVTVLIYPFT
ncbi:MAG: hypothetical protein K6D97_06380, partial [Clostridia bacterium]|nr:hypothetical protein [Clostridia bacterium]